MHLHTIMPALPLGRSHCSTNGWGLLRVITSQAAAAAEKSVRGPKRALSGHCKVLLCFLLYGNLEYVSC